MRLDSNLKLLERNGFIIRRGEDIAEGPLLDLLLDYDTLAPRILDVLATSAVRERFVAKGRFRPWLETVPLAVVRHPAAALVGLAHLAGEDAGIVARP